MPRDHRRLSGKPTPAWRGRTLTLAFAVLGSLAVVVPLLSTGSTARTADGVAIPAPLMYHRPFADPSVVESRLGLVGAATAPDIKIARAPADTGPWDVIATPALTRRPTWATSDDIWAPDIQRVRTGWVMYFAAGIAGADVNSRCIGAARSDTAIGPYTPVGSAPLVCPVVPGVPTAADIPPTRVDGRRLRVRGVIDPSSFVGKEGRRYLVYRTQGQPSSIRLVQLTRGGKRVQAGRQSVHLTSYPGTEENPVIVRRGSKWVMFTSVGWYGHCAYRTYWRRSPDFEDWSRATPQLLLSADDGLCGPGGADVLKRSDGTTQIYFHAWTCYLGPYPCPPDWNRNDPQKRRGMRSLYGANLRWTSWDRPVVDSWIGSTLPDPTPTATPTPTPAPPITPTD